MKRMKPSVSRWVKELPEGAVPVRARTDESSLIWTSPEDAADQKPLTVCWVGPTKRGFWQTLLGSALARGTWMEVPVFPQSPRPAKPTTTVKKKSWADVEVKAGRRLRIEPYDPDARDGDNDGIVQEGTAWERPAGTRLLDEAGKEIERGLTATSRASGLRVVDRDGKDVPFTPSYGAKKPAAGRGRISRAPQLGVTIGDQMEQTGRRRPAVPEGARAAEEIRKPSLLDPKGVREARKKGLLRGLPEDPRGWPPRFPWTPGDTASLRKRNPRLNEHRANQIKTMRDASRNALTRDFERIRDFADETDESKALNEALDALIKQHGSEQALIDHLVEREGELFAKQLDAVRGQPMLINIQPRYLMQLLGDGRYRSQFETGRSGGSFDPKYRREVERRFGVPDDEAIDVLRPVYGSLLPLDGERGIHAGPVEYRHLPAFSYGAATMILRERVRGRTTMTMGDSFGGQWAVPLTGDFSVDDAYAATRGGDWMTEARHAAFLEALGTVGYTLEDAKAYREMGEKYAERSGNPLERIYSYPQIAGDVPASSSYLFGRKDFGGPYMETQYHGGITLHDITAIHLPTDHVTDEERAALVERAAQLGIALVWVKPTDSMTDLPVR